MSDLPKLKASTFKKYLRMYAGSSSESADTWAGAETAKTKVGDIFLLFSPAAENLHEDPNFELELCGITLVFREDAFFPMNYLIEEVNYEMSFMEGVLSSKASEAKEAGLAFYCARCSISKTLSKEETSNLASMERKYGGSGERKKDNLPDPFYFFCAQLGEKLDASLENQPLSIAEIALCLLSPQTIPSGSKAPAAVTVFSPQEGSGIKLDQSDGSQNDTPRAADTAPTEASAKHPAEITADKAPQAKPTSETQKIKSKSDSLLPPVEESSGVWDMLKPKSKSSDLDSLLASFDSFPDLLADNKKDEQDKTQITDALTDILSTDELLGPIVGLGTPAEEAATKEAADKDAAANEAAAKDAADEDAAANEAAAKDAAAKDAAAKEAADKEAATKEAADKDAAANEAAAKEAADKEAAANEAAAKEAAANEAAAKEAAANEAAAKEAAANEAAAKEAAAKEAADKEAAAKEAAANEAAANEAAAKEAAANEAAAKEAAANEAAAKEAAANEAAANEAAAKEAAAKEVADKEIADKEIAAKETADKEAAAKEAAAKEAAAKEAAAKEAAAKDSAAKEAAAKEAAAKEAADKDSAAKEAADKDSAKEAVEKLEKESSEESGSDEKKDDKKEYSAKREAIAAKIKALVQEKKERKEDGGKKDAEPISESEQKTKDEALTTVKGETSNKSDGKDESNKDDSDEAEESTEAPARKTVSLAATMEKLEEQKLKANQRIEDFKHTHETTCAEGLATLRQNNAIFERDFTEKLKELKKVVISKLKVLSIEADQKLGAIVEDHKGKIDEQAAPALQELKEVADEKLIQATFAKLQAASDEFSSSFADTLGTLLDKDLEASLANVVKEELARLETWRTSELEAFSEYFEHSLLQLKQSRNKGNKALDDCVTSMSEELRRLKDFDLQRLALLKTEVNETFEQVREHSHIRLTQHCDKALAELILPLLSERKSSLALMSNDMRKHFADLLDSHSNESLSEFDKVLAKGKETLADCAKSMNEVKASYESEGKAKVEKVVASLTTHFDKRTAEIKAAFAESKDDKKGKGNLKDKLKQRAEQNRKEAIAKLDDLFGSIAERSSKHAEDHLKNWDAKNVTAAESIKAELEAEIASMKTRREASLKKLEKKLERLTEKAEAIPAEFIQ